MHEVLRALTSWVLAAFEAGVDDIQPLEDVQAQVEVVRAGIVGG